ncbi:MAG: hypothetical protein NW205_00020 [Hyphomicrobiaceae bacterium]|nr:hypothetical protein [Hyphomicrobiaceae bacterium]
MTTRTRCRHLPMLWAGLLLALAPATLAPGSPAGAHWLSKLTRQADEAGSGAGGTAARFGHVSLDDAAAVLRAAPEPPQGTALLAAHATSEGHWTFVNPAGVPFTAASPEEMARVARMLAPEAVDAAVAAGTAGPHLRLLLTEDTVFRHRDRLGELPDGAELNLVAQRRVMPLATHGTGTTASLVAEVRPGIVTTLGEAASFSELVWQLDRPLAAGDVRVLAFAANGAREVPAVARREAGGRLVADSVDPAQVAGALAALRGRTVLVAGNSRGGWLDSLPIGGGAAGRVDREALVTAARRYDVNLVIVETSVAWQPGQRDWLGRVMTMPGFEEAAAATTLGDLLAQLVAGPRRSEIGIFAGEAGRVRIALTPGGRDGGIGGFVDDVTDLVGEAVSQVAGTLATTTIEVDGNARSRQEELELRLVPWLPSDVQFVYLGLLVAGLAGFSAARGWWQRAWPVPALPPGARVVPGRYLLQWVRGLLFLIAFLPVAGLPALLFTVLMQVWWLVGLPFRLAARLFGRRTAQVS